MVQRARDVINGWFDGWAGKFVLGMLSFIIIGWTSWTCNRLLDDRARIIALEDSSRMKMAMLVEIKQAVEKTNQSVEKIRNDQLEFYKQESANWRGKRK